MIILTIVVSIVVILGFVLKLLEYLEIRPDDMKKFIAIRGRTFAWNAYLLIAALITIYFLAALSIVLSSAPFSIEVAILIVLILLALLSAWAPAIQRLHNKRINTAVNIVASCLLTLTIVGFWIAQWPEIQKAIVVTLLLLAIVVIYKVDRIIKKRKAR